MKNFDKNGKFILARIGGECLEKMSSLNPKFVTQLWFPSFRGHCNSPSLKSSSSLAFCNDSRSSVSSFRSFSISSASSAVASLTLCAPLFVLKKRNRSTVRFVCAKAARSRAPHHYQFVQQYMCVGSSLAGWREVFYNGPAVALSGGILCQTLLWDGKTVMVILTGDLMCQRVPF